jgi:hypothetical protein
MKIPQASGYISCWRAKKKVRRDYMAEGKDGQEEEMEDEIQGDWTEVKECRSRAPWLVEEMSGGGRVQGKSHLSIQKAFGAKIELKGSY